MLFSSILVNEVINKGFRIKKGKLDHGTTLEITKLKHDWNDLDSQRALLKDIYLLHPPNFKLKNFFAKPFFTVSSLKKIDKNFLSNSAYHLKVNFSSGNLLKYECKSISNKKRTGQISLEKKLLCGDASFELFYYYRSVSALKSALDFEMPPEKFKGILEILDDYSGVKLFRDSFRVKPYGEENNDWLGLELDFQNNTMFPRNSNIFGFVNISKLNNSKIVDTTTREGIILTPEFQDLISFVKTSIKEIFVEFRSQVESHKKKAKKAKKTKTKSKRKITPVASSKL